MAKEETQVPVASAKADTPKVEPSGKASADIKVHVTDERGEDQGFTIDLAVGAAEGDDTASVAERVRGWSKMYVDGLVYPFNRHNALALLNRFPYITDQLRKAIKTGERT